MLTVISVAGVLLLLERADSTDRVWSARGHLAPGLRVTAADVELVSAQVPAGRYVGAGESPIGQLVVRPVAAGELLPTAAVEPPDLAGQRLVTVAVDRLNLPVDLARGERVDVYVVSRDQAGERVGDPWLVLETAAVDTVADSESGFGGTSAQVGVVLAVEASQVGPLLEATADGTLVLVRVPG
jgi:hypothetical protein